MDDLVDGLVDDLVGDAGATRRGPAVRSGISVGDLATGLARQLRHAGMTVAPDRIGRLARALLLIPPETREQLYWVSRLALVSDRSQLAAFDAVFAAVFDGMLDPADSRGDPNAPPSVGSEERTRPVPREDPPADRGGAGLGDEPPPPAQAGAGETDPEDGEREALLAMASPERRLRETSFDQLTPEETDRVRHLVERIVLSTPMRRSRRSRPSHRTSAQVDVRRTVRSAQRGGGEVVELLHRERRARPRRLVLLCDVSASMEPYTRVFLSLLQGAVSGAGAEAFVFSTCLTRLTRQLVVRDPGQALAAAAAAGADWAGGTRLAESVRRFVDDHGRRGLARGAVVVMLSDGWSLDDPELVSEQMQRLRRLAFRIVWVNPRKAAEGFAPLVGGMAAALPFCDAFVSGHSLEALDEVARAVRA